LDQIFSHRVLLTEFARRRFAASLVNSQLFGQPAVLNSEGLYAHRLLNFPEMLNDQNCWGNCRPGRKQVSRQKFGVTTPPLLRRSTLDVDQEGAPNGELWSGLADCADALRRLRDKPLGRRLSLEAALADLQICYF
jgi:hypothetical protein